MAAFFAAMFFAVQVFGAAHAAQSAPEHNDNDCLVCIHSAYEDVDIALEPRPALIAPEVITAPADYKAVIIEGAAKRPHSRAPPPRAPPFIIQN